MASRFVAGDGEVYISVVVHSIYELQAIAQSSCLGLSGTDIHVYIQMRNDNTSRLLASLNSFTIRIA